MKKTMIIISIILLVWLVLLSTDLYLAKKNHQPFFCLEVEMEEGDGVRYIGLFYQVYHVVVMEDDEIIEDYGYIVVPWFYPYQDVLEEITISFYFLVITYFLSLS